MTGLFVLTLRELRARKVVAGLFAVTTLVWVVLALALQLDVVDGSLAGARVLGREAGDDAFTERRVIVDEATGEPVRDAEGDLVTETELAFGESPLESLVFRAQSFASGAAYWLGIFLALFATGGLVAALTERGQMDVALAKPLTRSQVLAARLIGVWAVMLALSVYLLGSVWLVMSIKTGVWNPRFLLAIGVVWAMFVVVYGVVTLVGVWSGSGPLSLVVTLGLLFVSLVLALPELEGDWGVIGRTWRPVVQGAYHALPKFPVVGDGLVPQLATGSPVATLYPFLSSLAFGAACYAAAFALFARKDL